MSKTQAAPKKFKKWPTEAEIANAVRKAARINLEKHFKGPPPSWLAWDWDDLKQEVILGVLQRLRRFKHGGKKTLAQFCYFAAYCAMMDICRKYKIDLNFDEDARIMDETGEKMGENSELKKEK